MSDLAAVYKATRQRITGLAAGHGDTVVPACPEWTVKQMLSHLAGVCSDILSGHMTRVGSDAWTDAQVQARTAASLDEIVAEWDDKGTQIEAIIPNFPEAAAKQLVMDTATHEHDLRGAVGQPGERQNEAVWIALDFLVGA